MSLTDPVADMLTRIRNACRAQHKTVDIPSSKMKEAIAGLLQREGYILDYQVLPDNKQNVLRVRLKYLEDKQNAIEGIRRVSKPSIRVYVNRKEARPEVHGRRHPLDHPRDSYGPGGTGKGRGWRGVVRGLVAGPHETLHTRIG